MRKVLEIIFVLFRPEPLPVSEEKEEDRGCCFYLKRKPNNSTVSCIVKTDEKLYNISEMSKNFDIYYIAHQTLHYYNKDKGHTCKEFIRDNQKNLVTHPMLDSCCNNWQRVIQQESRVITMNDTKMGPTKTLDIMLVEYFSTNDSMKDVAPWSKGTQTIMSIGTSTNLTISRPRSCPEKSDLETQLMIEMPEELNMCYVDLTTHPSYRQVAETIKFFFNATNRLHATGNQQTFSIPHYGVGKRYLAFQFFLCFSFLP